MNTGMTCRQGVRFLCDYTEGILGSPRRRAIDSHVRGCRRCRNFVAWYRATPRLFREATAAPLHAGVRGRLWLVLAEASQRARR